MDENVKINVGLPTSVLCLIAEKLGKGGIKALGGLLLSGPSGRDAVMANTTLAAVTLELNIDSVWYTRRESPYYNIFQKCLKANNPYAIYVESLRLAFRKGLIHTAIYMLDFVKQEFQLAELAYVMLSFLAGLEYPDVYHQFNQSTTFLDKVLLTEELTQHVHAVGPRRLNTYKDTARPPYLIDCMSYHAYVGDACHVRCNECILYYFCFELCRLS